MKILSTALLVAGLVALSACGGGGEENVASNVTAETYNIAPDENLLGNETLGDETLDDGTTNTGADNTTNTTGNAQ